jgi:DNA-binding IclR family transcriptional regulator
LALHDAALGGIELRRHALPHLRRLMERSGLTVHFAILFAILEGDDVVLIDKLRPPGVARLATWIGKRMGLHCTAVGKPIMAYFPKSSSSGSSGSVVSSAMWFRPL